MSVVSCSVFGGFITLSIGKSAPYGIAIVSCNMKLKIFLWNKQLGEVKMKNIIKSAVVLLGVLIAAQISTAQIRNSYHDLSSSGGQTIKSTNVDEVCVFCHTPHSQSSTTVLWNRTASAATYTVYTSPSMEQTPGQPGNASKNCLSCHDGTVAFNSLLNNPGRGVGTAPTMTASKMSGWDSIGVDLSNDHPVGFVYQTSYSSEVTSGDNGLRTAALSGTKVVVSNSGISLPLEGSAVATATLECTSCHDPHKTGAGHPTFLRVANTGSQMCFTCHNK